MNESSVNSFLDNLFSSGQFQRGKDGEHDIEAANVVASTNEVLITELMDTPKMETLAPVAKEEFRGELVYHIILDTNFPNRHKISEDAFRSKITGNIRDRLRSDRSKRLPVVYNIEDARKIATKLN